MLEIFVMGTKKGLNKLWVGIEFTVRIDKVPKFGEYEKALEGNADQSDDC